MNLKETVIVTLNMPISTQPSHKKKKKNFTVLDLLQCRKLFIQLSKLVSILISFYTAAKFICKLTLKQTMVLSFTNIEMSMADLANKSGTHMPREARHLTFWKAREQQV